MRKLLPYEHQLIEALGVSKEDYLNFVAIQQDYKDPKVGTALDVRNTVAAEVSLALTIIGILFQVGAALLAPKPEIPGSGERRNRQQRFAPSFGFNSTQELASYGDPINLVYTNQNDKGNVRVAGSLVWSAIENFGSTQFMQLMVAIGASQIKNIDYAKTAFGQISLKDLNKQSVFIFAKEEGVEGVPLFGDIQQDNFGKVNFFPSVLKPGVERPSCLIAVHTENKKLGFSQAYTPTTSTSLGVFDVIPINVDVQARNDKGKEKFAPLNITLPNEKNNSKWINAGTNLAKQFAVDEKIVLEFEKAGSKKGDKEARESAAAIRRQTLEALDFGSNYMLGTAKFRFIEFGDNTDIESKSVSATFQCVEAGFRPTTSYDLTQPRVEAPGTKQDLETAQEILRNDPEIITTTNVDGVIISEVEKLASLPRADEIIVFDQSLGIDIEFKADPPASTTWANTYSAKNSFDTPRNGSIAFTEKAQRKALANPPKLTGKEARKLLADRVDALQDLLAAIDTGNYDLDPGRYQEDVGDLPAGRVIDSKVNFHRIISGEQHVGYNSPFVKSYNLSAGQRVPYSLNYISENGTSYYFWFNGVTRQKTNTDNPKFFPDDGTLINLRNALALKLQNRSDNSAGADTFTQKYTDITQAAKRDPQPGAGADVTRKNLVLNKDSELEIYSYIDNAIGAEDDELQNLRTQINERVARNLSIQRKEARKIIRADIKTLKDEREGIPPGADIPDPVGAEAIEDLFETLIQEKKDALSNIDNILSNWDFYVEALDNSFFTKSLVKSEEASYDTLSACNSVKFSLKSRLSRRISGRQKKYSDQKMEEYSASDNGVKSRLAFFRASYKKNADGAFKTVPILFAIRRGSDADFYTQLDFYCNTLAKWQFKFDPVFDPQAEFRKDAFTAGYAMIENTTDVANIALTSDNEISTSSETVDVTFSWFGRTVLADANTKFPSEDERGPARTNEWDLFSVNSDTQVQFSFESGPEINLTAVTEQQFDTSYKNKYKNMTMMSLGIFAGRGIESLRSLTALVTHGKLCRTVESPNKATASSSYAPDIFVDTLLDKINGVGQYITRANIDTVSLQLAKDFCIHNNLPREADDAEKIDLFMDGIIADAGSWREFWINAAPFSLLELARKNGKDTLVPAIPCDDEGVAADNAGLPVTVTIAALFTTGNILEGSYKEEFLNYDTSTEDLIASVIYRDYNKDEMFSQKRSVNVKLEDVADRTAIRETFDLSEFVTEKEQAIMFGKFLCNQRRHIRKGIEFRTFPSEAGLEPGSFIYVDVGLKDWDQYSSGKVMAGGALNSPLAPVNEEGMQDVGSNVPFSFLLYEPLTGTVASENDIAVTTSDDGRSTATFTGTQQYEGWMFVMGKTKPNKRVFRVTELAIEEEGELSVKAIEYPCFEENDAAGVAGTRAHIADFRSSKFEVS